MQIFFGCLDLLAILRSGLDNGMLNFPIKNHFRTGLTVQKFNEKMRTKHTPAA